MQNHPKFHKNRQTHFIQVSPRRCRACWKCVEACPNGVLGKIQIFTHRHVHVDRAEKCKGCLKCVRACPNQAIQSIRQLSVA